MNLKKLSNKIAQKGVKLTVVAESLGITTQALHNKLSGKSEFRHSETVLLCELLNIDSAERDDIFFN